MQKTTNRVVTCPTRWFSTARRTWLSALGGVIGASLLVCARGMPLKAAETSAPARSIIGYAVPLTVRPGDKVDFKVNTLGGGTYEADLVRVVNGDQQSRYRKHFKVIPVEAPFAGRHEGREQHLNLGSYVQVEASKSLDELGSFTVSAWVFPTFVPIEHKAPDLENPDPFYPPTLTIGASVGKQTIVSRFDKVGRKGWALQFDRELRLQFVVGSGTGTLDVVTLPKAARAWDWSYVSASYDADTRKITVCVMEKPWAPGDKFTARKLQATARIRRPVPQSGPLRIAAVRAGKGTAKARFEKPADVFNGRIQDVRIASRALSMKELDQLSAERAPRGLRDSLVADWDFARGIGTTRVHDISGNGNSGTVVNLPERAVRGVFWNGKTIRWTDDPDQYDAITFHADDLYDAEWETDFSYTVPPDLKSGIYAARLRRGDFVEYITFFVAASKGKPQAKLAVWLSDYNYLAYSNVSLFGTVPHHYPGQNVNDDDTEFLKAHPEYATTGVYNKHVDDTYFHYGTRLRPDIHMKPGGLMYNFPADTHITAFLEHMGIAYDIITDELLDAEGVGLLKQYRAVISATHPEYVTTGIFDSVAKYTEQGGRFLYIGGNGWLFSVAGHPALPGVMESRNFHNIGERYLTNGRQGGLMVETGRHTGPIFGNEMAGMIFNGSSAYRKLKDASNPRAAWIFAGTTEGSVFGDYGIDKVHGGAAGFEIDRYNPSNGVPRHALHLATTEPLKPTIEDVELTQLPLTVRYHPEEREPWARADLVFFETPNGGAVFSTGSIAWMGSTLENDFDNDVARITHNVIRRFLDPTPFPPIPESDISGVDRAPSDPEYDHVEDAEK